MAGSETHWSLPEFITYFILPQRVKVVEGYCSSDHEFSTDDIIHLVELTCPDVQLTFTKEGRRHTKTVSTSHPAKFQLLPSGKRGGKYCPLLFRGVSELAKARPLAVRLTQPYTSCADGQLRLNKGDHLKVLRFVQRHGQKFLECKSSHLSRLVLLPVWDENGAFEEKVSDVYYTLQELVYTLPTRRYLKVASDIINDRNLLPGRIGEGTELILEQPQIFVNYYLISSPGAVKQIPANLDISVSAREDTYSSQFQPGYPLKLFVADNQRNFPLTAIVSDWFHESTIADNHEVHPGVSLFFHAVDEQQKILARCKATDTYFAIPKSYPAVFNIMPRTFNSFAEIPKVKGFRFKITETTEFIDVTKTKPQKLPSGMECAVYGTAVVTQNLNGRKRDVEMLKIHKNTNQAVLQVPLYVDCKIIEIVHIPVSLNLPSMSEHNMDFPVDVIFPKACHHFDGDSDPLPRGEVITLENYIREDTVLVSKLSKTQSKTSTFHLPVRTEVNIASKKY